MQFNNKSKKDCCDTVLQRFKNSKKKLTAASTMENSSHLSGDEPMTSPASDFLEVKPKIIIRNEDSFMVLLYIERLEPDD